MLTPHDRSYLRELTTYSLSRIEKEPRHLQQEIARLTRDMEGIGLSAATSQLVEFLSYRRLLLELAISHYRSFVESSRCVCDACVAVRLLSRLCACVR